MCCDVANGAKPTPVYVVDDRPQLPPRFKPAYQPVHSSTTGGGGGALSAKSAALAALIAAKPIRAVAAKRSRFIDASRCGAPAVSRQRLTVAKCLLETCDTSATFRKIKTFCGIARCSGPARIRKHPSWVSGAGRVAGAMFPTVNFASGGIVVRRGQAAWHAKILQVRSARCVSRRPARLPPPNPLAISALGRRSRRGGFFL